MVCVYTFPNGDVVTGKPALKAYLVANLGTLLPDRAAESGLFRRTPIQSAIDKPVSAAQLSMVEQTASGIVSRWANPPELIVFGNMQDQRIPKEVRDEDARQRAGGAVGEPEGFFYKGKAYLNASEISTPDDAARVLFHEALGHYGLRGVFGPALKSVLEQVVALRKADVLAKAREYGLDTNNQDALLQAAEEVLAEMAQKTPTVGFVKRAVAAIRAWLRQNVPAFAKLELSDSEIIQRFILPARAFVQNGAKAGKDMAAASFSRSNTAESEAFRKWFGDSKVVDAQGRPLVMYHGSSRIVLNNYDAKKANSTDAIDDIDAFKVGLSGAIYVAYDPQYAENYTNIQNPQNGGRIYAVYVKAENPFEYYNDAHLEKVQAALQRRGLFGKSANSNYVSETEWKALQRGSFSVLEREVVRDAIKEAGFDSYYVLEPDGVTDPETGDTIPARSLAVFEPTQIKSATGNNGNFDATNPDIRFSRAKPKPTGLTLDEQGLLRRVQAAVQDNMNRVRQVQDRIQEITGKPVPEAANYYGAEANRPGRIAARLEDAESHLTGPLIEKLAKSGHSMEDLSELLHAMHAKERNEAIAKINPDMPDGGSGMSNAKADEILQKYRGNRVLHALANDARTIARETLNLKLAYGLIDQERYDQIAETYSHYVPLKGDGEFGPQIKRAMGHDEREEHILENISRDYEQAVVVGEKNLARQSLLQMVLTNPDSKLWTVGVPPKGRYVAGTVFSVRKNGNEEATFTSQAQVTAFLEGKGAQAAAYEVWVNGERVREFVKPLQDNEVMVYVEGQPVRIQIVGDEQLARQLRPLNKEQMGPVMEFMRGVNRYLSKIYTGYNPAFILRNAARDAMTGTVNMIGNEGAATAAKAWGNYLKALNAMRVYAATGDDPGGETGRYLHEYRMHGGKTGASYMSDLEEQGKNLQRMFDDAYGAIGYLKDGKTGKAAAIAGRKIVGGMAHVVEVMNQATENALRLALYIAMREQGKTPGEAAQAAKSVTVDFDRKGTMTGALGAIFLFFNPAVQGTANAIKTLAKGAHKEQAWVALGALALLGAYAAGAGMDDDKDRWLGESWESRSSNLILNIGGHTLKVPVSMEFKPAYALGIALAEAKRGESKMKAAGHIVSSFIDAYFPLQGVFNAESDSHGADAVLAATPTVIKPAVQLATNRNTFGSQITPENEFTKDRPDNLKMFKGTKGSVYDTAAQGLASLGELTGAGKYENDITKVSPETLKFLWRTYTGGLGQFVTDVGSLAAISAQAPGSIESADVPIVKDFVKPKDVKAIRGRFYDLSKEAEEASSEFKQAKKAGDGEAIDKLMDRPGVPELISLDKMISKTKQAASVIRDEMVDVSADPDMPLSEKRAKLKALEADEEAIYRDAIDAFK